MTRSDSRPAPRHLLRSHADRVARLAVIGVCAICAGGCHNLKTLPPGLSYEGAPVPTADVALLVDNTWIDEWGERHVDQEIFDEVFSIIAQAYEFVVLDMFLYNDFQGPAPETTRALAEELTDALIAKKFSRPEMDIVLITDPLNVLYGGRPSAHLQRLERAGIRVVVTKLDKLHDSNTVYSFFWRLFAKPFGNSPGGLLPNPIGPGRVSIRSYLALLNFKANHRKVLIADNGTDLVGLVSSANPHDGSSAHRNAAVRFSGAAAKDLLATENAVLALSGQRPVHTSLPNVAAGLETGMTVQVVTEGKIRAAILSRLGELGSGDSVDLMMFYLSDREVIDAIRQLHDRGAHVRLLLDPNKDAFGRQKGGVPNRQVGFELDAFGVPIRWCDSHGEQCHSKMLIIHHASGRSEMITGSANFTRRNLSDLNLETNVVVSGETNAPIFTAARTFFEDSWHNAGDRLYSVPFERYEDGSWCRRQRYLFMEWSGMASF